MPTEHSYRKGDRVQPSPYALEHRVVGTSRYGRVVGFGRDGSVRVVWDNSSMRSIHNYRPDFLTPADVDAPDTSPRPRPRSAVRVACTCLARLKEFQAAMLRESVDKAGVLVEFGRTQRMLMEAVVTYLETGEGADAD